MYYYFVSFAHRHSFGNSCIHRDRPITTAKDIDELTNVISKQLEVSDVIILNYQLLKKEPKAK